MNILKSIAILLFITSCNFHKEDIKTVSKQTKTNLNNDSILVPKFEIEIKLSEKAEKKLNEDNETIMVQALFIGIPKDSTLQDEEYQKFGQLTIGMQKIELKKERLAKFYDCKI